MTYLTYLLALIPTRLYAFHAVNTGGLSQYATQPGLRPMSTVLDGGYLEKLDMSSSASSYMADVKKETTSAVQSNLETLYGAPPPQTHAPPPQARAAPPSSPASAGDYLSSIAGNSMPSSSVSYGLSADSTTTARSPPPGDYLSNVGTATMPSSSAPATSSSSPPAAGDYLAAIGGNSKPSSSMSYGFSAQGMTKAPPAPQGDYLSNVGAAAAVSSSAYSAPAMTTSAPSAPAAGEYLAHIGGNSKPSPSISYGFSADATTKAPPAPPGDYFSNMGAAASSSAYSTPATTSAPSAPAAGDYLAHIGGNSKPSPSKAYGFSADTMTKAPPALPGDYLSNMGSPASSSAYSAPASTSAPSAPAAGDYLAHIGGNSKPSPSTSYGFSPDVVTKAPPAPPGDYLSSMGSAAPAASSAYSATTAPSAPAAGDYLERIGGNSRPSPSMSFGFSADAMTKAPPASPGDYLSSMGGAASSSAYSAPATTSAHSAPSASDYLAHIGGNSKPSPSMSYGFSADVMTKAPPAVPGDYLSNMGPAASSSAYSAPATSSAPSAGDYLAHIGGNSKPSPSTSYGFSDDVMTKAPPALPGDYLSSMGRAAALSSTFAAPVTSSASSAPSAGDYLAHIGRDSKPSPSTSYGFSADVMTKAPPALPGDYLSSMGAPAASSSTFAAPATSSASSAPAVGDYLAHIGGDSKPSPSTSYGFSADVMTKAPPAVPGDYLSNMGAAAPSSASSAPPRTGAPSAPAVGDYLANIGGDSKPSSSVSYGFSADVSTKAPPALPGDYLSNMGSGVSGSSTSYSAPTASSAPAGDYLSNIGGNSMPSSSMSYGFSADVMTKAPPASPGDYLSNMGTAASSTSYSPPAASSSNAPAAGADYLASIGGNSMPSSSVSYGISADAMTKAPPATPGDYLSNMGTAAPSGFSAPVASSAPAGDYLSNIGGNSMPSSSVSYGISPDVITKAPPAPPGDYLASMMAASSSAAPAAAIASSAPAAGDYLTNIGGNSKPAPSKSYGFSADVMTTAPPALPGDYLSNVGAAASSSVHSAPASSSAPAGDYLTTIGGNSMPSSSVSYGIAADVMTKAPPATPGDYLANVGTAASSFYSAPAVSSASSPPATTDYLSNIGGDTKPPSSVSFGFSDDTMTRAPPATPGDYLANMGAAVPSSSSYSALPSAPVASSAGDYFSNIGGSTKPSSSASYGFSDDVMTKAPPATPGDYLSSMAGMRMPAASTSSYAAPPASSPGLSSPAVSSTPSVSSHGDYLSSIGSEAKSSSSVSYGLSDDTMTTAPPSNNGGDYLANIGAQINPSPASSYSSFAAPAPPAAPSSSDYLAMLAR